MVPSLSFQEFPLLPFFTYRAFGLIIQSEFELPELFPTLAEGTEQPVRIRLGEVPEALENPHAVGVLYQANHGEFLLKMDQIARFLVRDGQEIIIQLAEQGEMEEMRLFLLSSVFAALLHQRGVLALHSSGILVKIGGKEQAVLFSGRSGAGKSTLAAAFHQRGFPVIGDDKIAVMLQDGLPFAHPGFPRIKLWQDSADKLAVATRKLRRVRQDVEKFALSIEESFHASPLPLYAVYLLESQNEVKIELTPVEGMQKFSLLLKNTFRRRYLAGLGMKAEHFKLAAVVAKQVRVVIIRRPAYPFMLDELVNAILKDLGIDD